MKGRNIISVIRKKRATAILTGWSGKSSQWKWTVFCTWKNGGILKDKGHMGGGVVPGLSGSTSYWDSKSHVCQDRPCAS